MYVGGANKVIPKINSSLREWLTVFMVSTKCMEITAECSGGPLAYDITAELTLHDFCLVYYDA